MEKVRTYEAEARVDTGAVRTILSPLVVTQLGLGIQGQRMAEYADGRKDIVDVTEPVTLVITGRRTSEDALVLGDEVIIGQTALEVLDMVVDCAGRWLIPNPAHPDQPVIKVKRALL